MFGLVWFGLQGYITCPDIKQNSMTHKHMSDNKKTDSTFLNNAVGVDVQRSDPIQYTVIYLWVGLKGQDMIDTHTISEFASTGIFLLFLLAFPFQHNFYNLIIN